jgi:hypothetical protein
LPGKQPQYRAGRSIAQVESSARRLDSLTRSATRQAIGETAEHGPFRGTVAVVRLGRQADHLAPTGINPGQVEALDNPDRALSGIRWTSALSSR